MGDKDFIHLYDEHAKALYAFLSYRTGDRVLAEDLLADTFERVLRARRGFDPRKGSERTWLYSIALNCVRDHARRTASEARALARVDAPDEATQLDPQLNTVELRDAVHEALETLSDVEREAVALRFGADLALADIADLLNEPRTKVEARIYRGLKKLRTCLAPAL
jgi:RNA polymerase sigma factor (sigma-70 family)